VVVLGTVCPVTYIIQHQTSIDQVVDFLNDIYIINRCEHPVKYMHEGSRYLRSPNDVNDGDPRSRLRVPLQEYRQRYNDSQWKARSKLTRGVYTVFASEVSLYLEISLMIERLRSIPYDQ